MAQTPSTKTPARAARRPQEAPDAPGRGNRPPEGAQASQAPDFRPPFLTAARSHLEVAANPRPQMPSTQGLWGTGAVAALEALDSALEARSRAQALAVVTDRLPPVAGQWKQEVLAWFDREGL